MCRLPRRTPMRRRLPGGLLRGRPGPPGVRGPAARQEGVHAPLKVTLLNIS
jgi:hypothetical protein